ncbi:MAG TPA: hypothetical protein VMF03_21895 [Steroidobacteraceae bacterium]|nr:hypothetical protein [Steroidobacteraceae bacterium]
MNGWWLLQGLIVVAIAAALVYGLWLLRGHSRAASLAAELQARSIEAARAAVEAAARVQRLAARPVLKVGLVMQGSSDVGRTPVSFALQVRNVGHGTAVLQEIRLRVRGEPALSYAGGAPDLAGQVDAQVFQRAVGASVQSLSGRLQVTALTDDVRAVEAAGSLDLLRVQVFAHNAEVVEQGLATVSAEIAYRDLEGGEYLSTEQFRPVPS